jgi:hypothetical protein
MTYPPQGPYGGQQQYPHQQPPYGGYPPQPPYGGPGYGGYPPPKKSNTGLLVGIIAGTVVVLAAVGVTGFVAPGFFLSKTKESPAAGRQPSPGSTPTPSIPGARR